MTALGSHRMIKGCRAEVTSTKVFREVARKLLRLPNNDTGDGSPPWHLTPPPCSGSLLPSFDAVAVPLNGSLAGRPASAGSKVRILLMPWAACQGGEDDDSLEYVAIMTSGEQQQAIIMGRLANDDP